MSHLPYDVLQEIFLHLSNDKNTLIQLRQVCVAWSYPSGRVLFRTLQIMSTMHGVICGRSPTIPPEHLLTATRNVHVRFRQGAPPLIEAVLTQAYLIMIKREQKLSNCRIAYLSLDAPPPSLLKMLPITTFIPFAASVTRLRISHSRVVVALFRFICEFHRLEVLDLSDAFVPSLHTRRVLVESENVSDLFTLRLPQNLHTLHLPYFLLSSYGMLVTKWILGPQNASLRIRDFAVHHAPETAIAAPFLITYRGSLETFSFQIVDEVSHLLHLQSFTSLRFLLIDFGEDYLEALNKENCHQTSRSPELNVRATQLYHRQRQRYNFMIMNLPSSIERLTLVVRSVDLMKWLKWRMIDDTVTAQRMNNFKNCTVIVPESGEVARTLLKEDMPICTRRGLVLFKQVESIPPLTSVDSWSL